ncbi:Amidase [Ascochyta rabiei]|uniref:Carbon-nitrogen ligase activity, with glutamine as amido-N-donor n=1 Tax=Didymella rabiei TaxID=5454 RepID=A0A162YJY1_DIDRA|nr:Amidase [Ascochyta rabiei]KZM20088.1 carbon-nitrogen ligase activity, with glutamine as amido-N-donor [Ascochyta rabiei]UPX17157.1 Amidase [Ascochyta rabiei]
MSPRPLASSIPCLRDITLTDIHHHFASNALTSTQLVRAYLCRIAEVDQEFNSVIQTNPDALTIAQARDIERALGFHGSILQGVPILLKDNIPTLDATETTCGSLALVGTTSTREATVVTALRSAGAVILGKANMAEWAGFRSTSGCSGWSARGGQTYGPFVKGSKASGSSSGSAVATALGLCFAAIGTETCYSIVSPAEKSGIVGYKPTRDLIPSEGIIHASKRQDTVGVLTRTVKDAMLITYTLVLESLNCSSPRYLPGNPDSTVLMENLLAACYSKKTDLTGVRIGIPLDLIDFGDIPECKLEAFEDTLSLLETKSGAEIVRDVRVEGVCEYEGLSQEEKQVVLDTDMKIAIEAYLSDWKTDKQGISNLQDLIDFTKTCAEEEYPTRNVAGFERAQATDPESALYTTMLKKDEKFAGCLERTLDRYGCDVLVIPILSVTLQAFAAKAGSPVLSVPMGYYPEGTPIETDPKNGLIAKAPGIPFSVFVFGKTYGDASVIKVGHAIEKLKRVREQLKPYMLPGTEAVDVWKWGHLTCAELLDLPEFN